MQTSKYHYNATMVYDDDAIRRMFRTEYDTYEGKRKVARLAVAAVLIALAVFVDIPTPAKVICLLIGCWLFVAQDFPSRVLAEGVLEKRNGAVTTVAYRFDEKGVSVENGLHFAYAQVDRLIEDDDYYYIFRDKQTAVMLPKNALLPNSPERFQQFVAKESGKEWKRNVSLLSMNLKDVVGLWDKKKARGKA